VNRKLESDFHCYRCGVPKRMHVGDDLRCPAPPRKRSNGRCGPGSGDGCFKRNYQGARGRASLSLNVDQLELLDSLLLMLTRGADVSVVVRVNNFARVQSIVRAAMQRAADSA
jgi:hypothetical protein